MGGTPVQGRLLGWIVGKVGCSIMGLAFLVMWINPVVGAMAAISTAVAFAIRAENDMADTAAGVSGQPPSTPDVRGPQFAPIRT